MFSQRALFGDVGERDPVVLLVSGEGHLGLLPWPRLTEPEMRRLGFPCHVIGDVVRRIVAFSEKRIAVDFPDWVLRQTLRTISACCPDFDTSWEYIHTILWQVISQ